MKELEENGANPKIQESRTYDTATEELENSGRNVVEFLSDRNHPIELDIQSPM